VEVSGQLRVPAALLSGKEPPAAYLIEGWVGLRVGLVAVTKREIPLIAPSGNKTPIVQSVAQRYTD